MPAFRYFTTAYYHKPYNTHTNRMYSDMTNEEATIVRLMLHYQNKLNNAHGCSCVSFCWKRLLQLTDRF
jgi:hypothetical protein